MTITWLSPIATGPATAIQAGILAPAESAASTAPSSAPATIAPANDASHAAHPRPAWRSSAYRIVACRVGTRWSYAAWGPDRQPRGWAYRDYANGQARHWHPDGGRIVYPIGHAIPQRRDLLGIHPTAALARAQCEAHHAATGARP